MISEPKTFIDTITCKLEDEQHQGQCYITQEEVTIDTITCSIEDQDTTQSNQNSNTLTNLILDNIILNGGTGSVAGDVLLALRDKGKDSSIYDGVVKIKAFSNLLGSLFGNDEDSDDWW